MRLVPKSQLEGGVWTVSSGNMAQGVAWCSRQMGVPCSVVVDNGAPEAKLAAIARLGASIVKLPFAEWFEVVHTGTREEMDGLFIHPVFDSGVMAGHGVIALEVLEDLPDVDAVVIPYGGGGLSCGMAVALRELRPEAKVFASEVETGTPFSSSLDAGRPVEVKLTPSFVTGIGGTPMLEPMWPMTSSLLDGSLVAVRRGDRRRDQADGRAKQHHRRGRWGHARSRRTGGKGRLRQGRLRRLGRQHRRRQASRYLPGPRTLASPAATPSPFPLRPPAPAPSPQPSDPQPPLALGEQPPGDVPPRVPEGARDHAEVRGFHAQLLRRPTE